MTLWTQLAHARTHGGDDILLRQRADIFEIRFNGLELMSNLNHQSEEVLALRSIRLFAEPPRRVLIGGLGMGFTLRAVLDALPQDAEVVVAELVPTIVDWNRGPLAHLAGAPLDDPRVRLVVADVMDILRAEERGFDLILMDTDNGPDFLARPQNDALWQETGIATIMGALCPQGMVTFWSATKSAAFEDALDAAGTVWRCEAVPLVPGRVDAMHYLYFTASEARSLADRFFSAAAPQEALTRAKDLAA